jgi:hypothetical protein
MEDNIKNINTKIPIEQIINETLETSPKSECEFNNLLVYNFLKILFEDQKFIGGSKNKLTKYNKKQNKNKLTKYNKKQNKMKTRKLRNKLIQKGGTNAKLILFMVALLVTFVKGIKNLTDSEVIQRVKEANEVSDIFRNYYGTCTLNTMLFLKTIDLPTFEELSVNIMTKKSQALNSVKMSSILNKELNVNTKWYMLSGRKPDEELSEKDILNRFIERIKNKLILIRKEYNFYLNQSILTVMNYPKKGKDVGHSVILWLTSFNEIIIIDPQTFVKQGIILYTSELTTKKYMNNDQSLKIDSLRIYIRNNIDIYDEGRDTDILVSLHIEINDIYGKSYLSIANKNLIDTISKIKETEELLQYKNVEQYGEML